MKKGVWQSAHYPEGSRDGGPVPQGWPPAVDLLPFEGTSVLSCIDSIRVGGARGASGGSKSSNGSSNYSGPRDASVHDRRCPGGCFRVGLLRRSTQFCWLNASGQSSRCLRGASRSLKTSMLFCSRPIGSPMAQRQHTKVRLSVRNRRSRLCPGFVQVAEVDRRCSVRRATPGCGWGALTGPSHRWRVRRWRKRIVIPLSVKSKALPNVGEGSEEGSFIEGRCFGPSHAITIYAGGGSGGLGRTDQAGNELCEVRAVTETSEVVGSWQAPAGIILALGRRYGG